MEANYKNTNKLTGFELYPFQRNLLRAYKNNPLNIVWKARQMGVTTMNSVHAIEHVIEKGGNGNVLIVGNNLIMASRLLNVIREMVINGIDKEVIQKSTSDYITFRNGGYIGITSDRIIEESSIERLHGWDVSLTIIEEGAYYKNLLSTIDRILSKILRLGGECIVASTKNEKDDSFMKLFKGALRMENAFNPILLDKEVHPEYDDEWEKRMRTIMGDDVFDVEYESF